MDPTLPVIRHFFGISTDESLLTVVPTRLKVSFASQHTRLLFYRLLQSLSHRHHPLGMTAMRQNPAMSMYSSLWGPGNLDGCNHFIIRRLSLIVRGRSPVDPHRLSGLVNMNCANYSCKIALIADFALLMAQGSSRIALLVKSPLSHGIQNSFKLQLFPRFYIPSGRWRTRRAFYIFSFHCGIPRWTLRAIDLFPLFILFRGLLPAQQENGSVYWFDFGDGSALKNLSTYPSSVNAMLA